MIIESRFCGPPFSAHGGTAAGLFAELVGGAPAEVRLLGPPPLSTELGHRSEDDGLIVITGPAGDVATVRELDAPVHVRGFSRVAEAELDAAAESYLADVAERGHPFPTCFGCGTDREPGDALRQFTGPVGDGSTAGARFRVDGEGQLPAWMGWAGLDCPSGHTIRAVLDGGPGAVVLGTMSAQVGDIHAGVDYQVRGRLVEAKGRKYTTEVEMLAPDGASVAAARAVWIAVDPSTIRPAGG